MIDYPHIVGKNGMRIFADTYGIFIYGFSKELILHESTLEKKFDFQFTVLYAYTSKDNDSLNQLQNMFKEYHCLMWTRFFLSKTSN